MSLIKSIKSRLRLFIIATILLTTFLTYHFLNAFYLNSHEKYMKAYISDLLAEIPKDYNHIQEAIDWTKANLNLNIYVLDNAEDLMARVPSTIDKNKVLSVSDQQQLEQGNIVINKIKTVDPELNLLLFIHPIIKDNKIENFLFLHVPINNMKDVELAFSRITILIAILSAGIAIMIHQKLFGKSYNQLLDIKLAAIEVSRGNLDTRIAKDSSDELGEISEEFNTMSTTLKKEQSRIKEFMEDFSHEIKSPLALVKIYNQALIDNIIQTPEEQQKYHHLIDRETNRLQKLIQNFLDFAKLDAQSVELERLPIVFAQSLEDIMMKYELTFKEKNIKLDMKLDYNIIISADQDRLEQIIQNIIFNAIKYSKDEPRINIIMERKAETCVLAISDNGLGISEEHLSVITNRFIRVKKVRSRKESGTGLGLSIVEKLMDLHGGKLTIESQLGVGTTVKLIFPVIEAED